MVRRVDHGESHVTNTHAHLVHHCGHRADRRDTDDRLGALGRYAGYSELLRSRVSHGSSDHELTPGQRAEGLQWVVYESGFVSPEEVATFEETFGVENQTVTVQIFTRFVRKNCSDDPFVR